MHNDLWYIIHGKRAAYQELYPESPDISTPIHAIDSYFGGELFGNPWGNGSMVALQMALNQAQEKIKQDPNPVLSLENAVNVIDELYVYLSDQARLGRNSSLIKRYIELKGIPISEVRENVDAIGAFIKDLKTESKSLKAMLGVSDLKEFFATQKVIPRFGIIASGNLGLYDTVILIISGILAQAARNGNQLSIIIKPSIYDFLFYELIQLLPQDVRSAFTRITWRSGEGILPDSTLMPLLIGGIDGCIYFGTRNTLKEFQSVIEQNHEHHYFYYDHFPIMVLRPDASREEIDAAAVLAVRLAYKQKGEACLSLQDVFIHQDVYDDFFLAILNQWRKLSTNKSEDLFDEGVQLSRYSAAHLDEISRLMNRLNGALIGRVFPETYQTDLLINHEIGLDDWVLATENAAPFLCLAKYSHDQILLESLETYLRNSSSDKFIYSLIISSPNSKLSPTLLNHLGKLSHRVEIIPSKSSALSYVPYIPGIPHCGGISFLADMFGIAHRSECYIK